MGHGVVTFIRFANVLRDTCLHTRIEHEGKLAEEEPCGRPAIEWWLVGMWGGQIVDPRCEIHLPPTGPSFFPFHGKDARRLSPDELLVLRVMET